MANLSSGDLVTDVEDGVATYLPDGEAAATYEEWIAFIDAMNTSLVGDTVTGWLCAYMWANGGTRVIFSTVAE